MFNIANSQSILIHKTSGTVITEELSDIDGITFLIDTNNFNLVIGQTYQGGIIFYLDSTGKHGLLAAPFDQDTAVEWGCYGTLITGADGTEIGTGKQNTADIEQECTTFGTAADICANLALGGYLNCRPPYPSLLNPCIDS